MPGITTPEAYADIPFPVHGIDSSRAFAEEPAGTTPDATNVRTFEPATLRARGGARPGLERFIDQQLPLSFVSGSHLIQHVNTVVQVDGTALLNNYDFLPADLADPSDAGPSSLWPPDQSSRNPGWTIPTGGTGIPPNKNARRSPLIVWANPANINAGTALSSTQLNAVAKDPRTMDVLSGSYSYDPASGAILSGGNDQTLTVHFTPSDTGTYKNSYKTALIDVISPSQGLAFEQQASNFDTVLPVTAALPSNVRQGNLLLVGVYSDDTSTATEPTLTITDSLGNTYTRLLHRTAPYTSNPGPSPGVVSLSLWSAASIATGPNTVSVDSSAGVFGAVAFGVLEYSGQSASPLDSTASNGDATAFWDSTPPTSPQGVGPVAVSAVGSMVLMVLAASESEPDLSAYTLRVHTISGGTFPTLFVAEVLPTDVAQTIQGVNTGLFGHFLALGASFKKA